MGGEIISELGGGIIPLRGAQSSRNWGAASPGISTWAGPTFQPALRSSPLTIALRPRSRLAVDFKTSAAGSAKVKALGICEFRNLARTRHAAGLITRSPAAISNGKFFPCWNRKGSACSYGVPLAGGLLSGKYSQTHQKPADSRRTNYDFPIVDKERTWKILDVMAPIAQAHGCSPARISIAGSWQSQW